MLIIQFELIPLRFYSKQQIIFASISHRSMTFLYNREFVLFECLSEGLVKGFIK